MIDVPNIKLVVSGLMALGVVIEGVKERKKGERMRHGRDVGGEHGHGVVGGYGGVTIKDNVWW